MKNAGIILVAIIVLFFLWFRIKVPTNNVQTSPDMILPSLPHLTYTVPETEPNPLGNVPHLQDYNWLGESPCGGCSSTKEKQIVIIDDFHGVPGTSSGYKYFNADIPYDPALKGAANLARVPSPPIYPSYQAPGALFWWGWADSSDLTYTPGSIANNSAGAVNVKIGLPATPVPKGTRVIFTNMGGVLPTGFFAPWTRDDGGSIISPITAIKFLGTHYNLDASRSVGL